MEKDEASISSLLKASYPDLMSASYDPALLAAALPMMTRANPILLASGTYYVVENDAGGMVGCGGWSKDRPGNGEISQNLGHIRHFATDPKWLCCGIGRMLYTRCKTVARASRMDRFECYASLNAEGFYKALGFEATGRVDILMGPQVRLPAVLMTAAV